MSSIIKTFRQLAYNMSVRDPVQCTLEVQFLQSVNQAAMRPTHFAKKALLDSPDNPLPCSLRIECKQ